MGYSVRVYVGVQMVRDRKWRGFGSEGIRYDPEHVSLAVTDLVIAFVTTIFNSLQLAESELIAGRRPKSETGPGSESSITGIGVENETRIEIDIDQYKRRKTHSASIFVQLRQH
ncbi:hypothetical protein EVAR_93153_1 [Eumeta japonica]|uniref:Uncharacterized protein n=1 Tax=Eumeta variegata TaxID=151549 RepID=A0A4C1THZ2_EUMVA|nr:hypothetical protein EVAR_93153_1 [Eumeta japonica]